MPADITTATTYINENCIEVDDWVDADDARKTRLLNVSVRTLNQYYGKKYVIPDEAAYEFANTLSILFNDNGNIARQGMASFGLTGVFSVNFKEGTTTMPYDSLRKFIPQVALDIIGSANDVSLGRKTMKWTVI